MARKSLKWLTVVMVLLLASGLAFGAGPKTEVKVGLLIPLTQMASIFGDSMLNGAKAAIEEYNSNPSGKFIIKYYVEDDATNPEVGAQKANKFIDQIKVDAIIGTLFTSVRQAVFNITSKKSVIYMNPTYDAGGLCNKYYFSTGAVINQQFGEFVPWMIKKFGKKIYLLGSDYSWPRESFALAKEIIAKEGGTVVGEEYVGFGITDFSDVIRRIQAASPDILIPLVAGSDGVAFTKQWVDFGLKGKIAYCSSGFTELAAAGMDKESADGIYAFADYFMTVDTPENAKFLRNYTKAAGKPDLVDLFGVNMYNNIHLYTLALEKAGTKDKDAVVKALEGMHFRSPAGDIWLDPDNHYAHLRSFIGLCTTDTWPKFKIMEDFGNIAPDPKCTNN
ncbi:MAG: substrate-binding protein [Spirochaetia bacterium]|jgi:ABC-type branched-subunit amino acid transport system substrate-binding protein